MRRRELRLGLGLARAESELITSRRSCDEARLEEVELAWPQVEPSPVTSSQSPSEAQDPRLLRIGLNRLLAALNAQELFVTSHDWLVYGLLPQNCPSRLKRRGITATMGCNWA